MPAGLYRTEADADAGRPARGDTAGFNTEEYRLIEENPFRDVRANPLSTFAIDVDAASYSNVRRFLRERRLPPRDAVRIEELINYFDYDYPDPTGEHPFSINTEVSAAPWNPEHRLVRGWSGASCPRGTWCS
jgi:Ca-activated chloride channel family protein